jgi:hypothetical protein
MSSPLIELFASSICSLPLWIDPLVKWDAIAVVKRSRWAVENLIAALYLLDFIVHNILHLLSPEE